MKKIALIPLFAVFLVPDSICADTLVLNCSAPSRHGLNAEIRIEEGGAAKLLLSGKTQSTCRLKITVFEYNPKGVIPTVNFEFRILGCNPSVDASVRKLLLDPIYLYLERESKNQPAVGRIQWVRYEQPGQCAVRTLLSEDLRRDQEKWKRHLWGE
jgi:hypothetical protein